MSDIIVNVLLFSLIAFLLGKAVWQDSESFKPLKEQIKKRWKEYRNLDTLKQIYVPVAFVILVCLSVLFFRLLDDVLGIPESTNESGVRNTAIAFLGTVSGIGALFGVWLAIRRSDENKRQNDVAQKQADIAEQGSITDRINKATEGLGKNDGEDPVIEVRLGSLLALERIAQDSLRDHISIMEILCAYVRTNSPRDEQTDETIPLREDIQTALTIIGRRERWESGEKYLKKEIERGYKIDLHKCDLHGAQLDRANLNNAILNEANLRNAEIGGAKLNGTQFGNADMSHAKLSSSKAINASFTSTNLSYAKIGLANLSRSQFYGTDLTNAWLYEADLSNAQLYNTKFNKATLMNANLTNMRITGADMSDTDLSRAHAYDGDFSECKNLTQEQIDKMFCSIDIGLPEDLEHSDHWPGDDLTEHEFNNAYGEWQNMIYEEEQEREEMEAQILAEEAAREKLAQEEAEREKLAAQKAELKEEKIEEMIQDDLADYDADMRVSLEKDSRGE